MQRLWNSRRYDVRQPNNETKTIYLCQQCYRILEGERIIKNGQVIKW